MPKKVGEKQVIEIDNKPFATGNFSRVYRGRFDDKDVIVKRLDYFPEEEDENDNDITGLGIKSDELEIHRNFHHENVVKYLFKDITEEYIYIVLEKCECTLQELITVNNRKHPILPLVILWQSTAGLAYLHSKGVIHRDLKPTNILLIQQDGNWIAKIADFGISKKLSPDRTKLTQTSVKGTMGYMSPEALREEKLSPRSDIYSLGVVFYYVLSNGEHPHGSDNLKVESKIRDGAEPSLEEMDKEYYYNAKSLIRSMLAHDYMDRPDVNEVRAHHLFWEAERKLTFIQDVSDYSIAKDTYDKMSPLLEANSNEVTGESWRDTLYNVSDVIKQTFLEMKNKRQGDSFIDLLRTIRNLKHHYNEKSKEFQEEIGTMPDGVFSFFASLFPKLMSHTYDVMKSQKNVYTFEKYYKYVDHYPTNFNRSPPRPAKPTDCNKSEGIENNSSKRNDSDKSVHPKQEVKEELILRKYQKELAEEALGGNNSLIVAPTGSGKTAVLAEITQKHISATQDSRVIFMVPKTALARQQFLFLKRFLSCSLNFIIGETTFQSPPGQKILESQVIVLTPQILINELKKKPDASYISFKDISMLLLDECHHATKKHPYKEIMDMLLDYQTSTTDSRPIQIVGVTASPGVGKAKDREKVTNNLLHLLANLNIMLPPSIVEKNVNELKKHQNFVKEYNREIQTESEFGEAVMDVMLSIENDVTELNKKNDASHLNKPPKDKSKQSYENWANELMQYGKLNMRDQEQGRILITYAEHLKMYNCLLQLKDLVPNAINHTNKMVKFQCVGFENKKLSDQNQALMEQARKIKVPMLDCLKQLLLDEFRRNKDARCVIFIKRKLTARSLEECFASDDDLSFLNAKHMIGAHDSDSEEHDAMTKVAQENILTSFREGNVKVIIATSVAEEGLDISACNLVIMYNYVTGEVGRIQRAGRGRASDSRAILLTCMDSKHVQMEEDNKTCARASDQAISDVKKFPVEVLEQKIREIQKEDKDKRKRKKDMALKAKGEDPSSKWEILCGKCKNFLTTADKLRHIDDMHVVVKDPNFESRVVKHLKEQKKGPNVHGTADFNCNNPKCGIKVALEMVHGKRKYPVFSIKKIILRKEGGKLCDPKKRSNLPFVIGRSVHESEDEDEYEETNQQNEMPLEELSLDENDRAEMLELFNKSTA